MRLVFALALMPLPALAWDFSPDPICTLTHEAQAADFTITYDVSIPQYALSIRLREGTWDDAQALQLAFLGPQSLQIGTTQHRLSDNDIVLIVRDRGFGNVLNGLEFNDTAVATSGRTRVSFALDQAAPAVRAFRACPDDTPASS